MYSHNPEKHSVLDVFCDFVRFLFILFPAFRYFFTYPRKNILFLLILWFFSVFVHFVPHLLLFIYIPLKNFLFLSCVSLQLGSFTRLNTRVGKLRRWWAQMCRVTPPLHQLITAKLYKNWKVIGKNSSGCISTIPFPKVFAYFHSPYPMFCPFPAAAPYFLSYFLLALIFLSFLSQRISLRPFFTIHTVCSLAQTFGSEKFNAIVYSYLLHLLLILDFFFPYALF